MDELLADLGAQHRELWSLLEPLDDAGWARPTPCEGWDVADVVLHLHQTDQLGIASVRGDLSPDIEEFMRAGGESSVDDAAAASVQDARGADGAAVGAQWRAIGRRAPRGVGRGRPEHPVAVGGGPADRAHARRDAAFGVLDPHRRCCDRARRGARADEPAPPCRPAGVADGPLRVRAGRPGAPRAGRIRSRRTRR